MLAVCLGVIPLRADAPVVGANLPWWAYGLDFSGNAWGSEVILSSGWSHQNYPDSRAISRVRREEVSFCGAPALRAILNLQGGHPNQSSGEVFLNVLNHPPREGVLPAVAASLDLDGIRVRARIWFPPGSAGPGVAPNGFQFLVKSKAGEEYPSLYTTWQNIDPAWEGRCTEVEALISNSGPAAFRSEKFDAKQSVLIGFKIGAGANSRAVVSGFLDLEWYRFEKAVPLVFDFNLLEAEKDFIAVNSLTNSQVAVLRTWIFGDGRAAPLFGPDGGVSGLPAEFFENFDELLRIAERQRIRILPTIIDYPWFARARVINGVQIGGHSGALRDPLKRQAFLDRALLPILQRYGNNEWIAGWDLGNELDWITVGVADQIGADFDPLTLAEMREYIRLATDLIHSTARQPATVGTARRKWLRHFTGLGLDYYSFHWYEDFEAEEPFPFRPYSELGLDKPCVVGEVPTANTRYTLPDFLHASGAGGYSGVYPWSVRAFDSFSNFDKAALDLVANSPQVSATNVVNAASYRSGPVAPDSWVTLYGQRLARVSETASGALAAELGGVTVEIVDGTGRIHNAKLLYASPTQINLLVPAGVPGGEATLVVRRDDGSSGRAQVQVAGVAPGLFAANGDGRGAAAAVVVKVGPDGSQTTLPAFVCGTAPGSCVPNPIDLSGSSDTVVLSLFGTGLRGSCGPGPVRVTIGGVPADVLYACSQGTPGLDQVNVLIPRVPVLQGEKEIQLTAGGVSANPVLATFR
jgi:uncharacterized protein (TIGR03437 family)